MFYITKQQNLIYLHCLKQLPDLVPRCHLIWPSNYFEMVLILNSEIYELQDILYNNIKISLGITTKNVLTHFLAFILKITISDIFPMQITLIFSFTKNINNSNFDLLIANRQPILSMEILGFLRRSIIKGNIHQSFEYSTKRCGAHKNYLFTIGRRVGMGQLQLFIYHNGQLKSKDSFSIVWIKIGQ